MTFQAPCYAQMRAGRIDENRERCAAPGRFARETPLHADDRGNLVQHFGDADDRDLVIVRDQLNARLGHARATHAEQLCARALTQIGGKPSGVHIARGFSSGDENFRRRHWR